MKSKKFLVMVMAATLTFGVVVFSGCRDNDKDKDTAQTPTESVQVANDNMTMTEQDGNGIQMLSVVITPDKYADYGVSENAESAHLVTASYPEDEYVSNTAVDWYVEFVKADSEWATGKKASDYVTVTPTSDGALTAVVEGLKAFGEPIRVVCASRQSPDKSDSFICDYASKIAKMNITFSGVKDMWNFADVTPLEFYYTTIADELSGLSNPENYIDLNKVDMVGVYTWDLSVLSAALGTTLSWADSAFHYNRWTDLVNVDDYLAMVEESTVLTKNPFASTDEKGRCQTAYAPGLPGIEWLAEENRNSILYYWTLNHGGDVSDSRLEKYDDGGAAYYEYLRIMNALAALSGDTVAYTCAIDIGHTYQGEAVEVEIVFKVTDASEYFKAEASSLTLDTDHILFEP